MPNSQYEHFRNFSSNGMSFAEKKQVWLDISDMTEAEFDAMMADEKSREPGVPQVGQIAHGFTAERLGEGRIRTLVLHRGLLRDHAPAILIGQPELAVGIEVKQRL